ncbi:hypothetical protein Z043_125910 [Scleropages formosus]|uniref:EF-hand domain-containing protein n=1 Tax=Scleropages formosus TaxID=113540 RepID=A0A0P7TG90_SCLFO|nr:hypothetical protein Z043_125910 [Scleropages formosus]
MDLVRSSLGRGGGGPGWITASQLRNVLEQLKVRLENREFVKLWRRYDEDRLGVVRLDVLLKKLGPSSGEQLGATADEDKAGNLGQAFYEAEEERQASIAVETWLKDRFREGVQKMKTEFDKLDPESSGKVGPRGGFRTPAVLRAAQVRPDSFLKVLHTFGLRLKAKHLRLFLARCGLEVRKMGIDYPEFLRRFQDRGEEGVLHRILSNPKHRFHQSESASHMTSVSAVEAHLTRLFQSEYLALLDIFR